MIKHIYNKCFNCKKYKFFVRKRKVTLPNGSIANSREPFCGKCHKALQTQLEVKL